MRLGFFSHFFSNDSRFTSVMLSFLFLRLLEINIVGFLTLFIVQAWAHLRAVLRFTISIFQAPVSELKMTPLSVPILPILQLFSSMCGLV